MIATQRISSTTSKPVQVDNYEIINVLKWNNSKWKNLSPYLLKTDGEESCRNDGGIIFENYYQGCKVYDTVYSIEIYPSRYHANNPKYLWWKYEPLNSEGDVLIDKNGILCHDLYLNWRNSLWSCDKPIRYPNGIHRRKRTQYALRIKEDGTCDKMGYLESRIVLYYNEYIRLVKKTPEYNALVEKLKNGTNLMICEVDVPAKGKMGDYGKDCDDNNVCIMSVDKLDRLMYDTSEAFGHGLCLAKSLLADIL